MDRERRWVEMVCCTGIQERRSYSPRVLQKVETRHGVDSKEKIDAYGSFELATCASPTSKSDFAASISASTKSSETSGPELCEVFPGARPR